MDVRRKKSYVSPQEEVGELGYTHERSRSHWTPLHYAAKFDFFFFF